MFGEEEEDPGGIGGFGGFPGMFRFASSGFGGPGGPGASTQMSGMGAKKKTQDPPIYHDLLVALEDIATGTTKKMKMSYH